MIDAHSHLPGDHPAALAMLEQLDLKVLNVCVASRDFPTLEQQRRWYGNLARQHPDRYAWCTTFSLDGFGRDDWARRAIADLQRDFDAGASAAKVWKNVGMELRDPDTGEYVFVDDDRFAPIFEYLQSAGKPLLMHIAEPLACWQPLDPASPHYGYYAAFPQWHWYNRTDVPSHERLIASRDAVIQRHPRLTVIGAHFGSLEYDLAEVARRLERYPNFHVDTSARLGDVAMLARRDHAATRDFFIRFADRVLWGKDWVFMQPLGQLPEDELTRSVGFVDRGYRQERQFYAGRDPMQVNRQEVQPLNLPAEVLDRLFVRNAQRIYRI